MVYLPGNVLVTGFQTNVLARFTQDTDGSLTWVQNFPTGLDPISATATSGPDYGCVYIANLGSGPGQGSISSYHITFPDQVTPLGEYPVAGTPRAVASVADPLGGSFLVITESEGGFTAYTWTLSRNNLGSISGCELVPVGDAPTGTYPIAVTMANYQ